MSSKYRIYHNPRCSKSREVLKLLRDRGIEPEVIDYLATPLTAKEIEALIALSEESPEAFVRKKEPEFKELKKINLANAKEVAKAISLYPKLLERPIVVKNKHAVIARPVDKLDILLPGT